MAKSFPTAIFFSRQNSFCIWDEGVVLDALETALNAEKASFKRLPPEHGNALGSIDIYCSHEDIALRYRKQYESIRGTV